MAWEHLWAGASGTLCIVGPWLGLMLTLLGPYEQMQATSQWEEVAHSGALGLLSPLVRLFVNQENISRATKGYQKVRELLCSWVQVKKEKHLTLTRGIRVSYLGFGTA